MLELLSKIKIAKQVAKVMPINIFFSYMYVDAFCKMFKKIQTAVY